MQGYLWLYRQSIIGVAKKSATRIFDIIDINPKRIMPEQFLFDVPINTNTSSSPTINPLFSDVFLCILCFRANFNSGTGFGFLISKSIIIIITTQPFLHRTPDLSRALMEMTPLITDIMLFGESPVLCLSKKCHSYDLMVERQ